jgi:hypothetical protein
MNLQGTLAAVAELIHSDVLKNEADVKQFVLLPVLRALDWDDSDPLTIRPEYAAGPGQVDYALLHDGRPLVFIEAKRLGNVDDKGEEQLFQYASNKGIPLLILTDGDRWDFYLSMAAGDPPERRFFRMELSHLEHKVSDFVGFLEEHLRQAAVVSGRAKSSAERLHASDVERKKAQKRIPQAWRDLVGEPDDLLCDLLAEKVESECGTRPHSDDVERFLTGLSTGPLTSQPRKRPRLRGRRLRERQSVASHKPQPASPRPQRNKTRIVGFVLGNERVETGSAIAALAEVIKNFAGNDSSFMERFSESTVGRTRRVVARTPDALFFGRSDFAEKYSEDLGSGWWLGTNRSTDTVRRNIEVACRIANVRFGSELKLIEGEHGRRRT